MAGNRKRRTSRVMVVVAAVLVVGAGVAFVTGLGPSNEPDTGQAQSELPPGTAAVTRQTLVDTETEDGGLSYGDAATVSAGLSGTLTALPAAGATLNRGEVVYRVDDKPIVLLYGTLPAYRPLSTGTEGADVEQFEENLHALGYTGFTVDEEYSAATTTAVKKWQGDLGLDETGTVEQGRVIYAAGPVRVDTLKATVGVAAKPGEGLLTYTSTSRVVVVELTASQYRLAVKGAAVTVTPPDGKPVTGKVAETETVVETTGGAESNSSETKIKATVTVDDETALAGLDQAVLKVAFTASQRENVLTVPVGALLALAEGGYGVQVVDGTTSRIVAVQTGLFAKGRVEVSGEGLTEGMKVGTP
jgi:peptidoglycan hydrolase-like protein with peptidoglycan-binding domain